MNAPAQAMALVVAIDDGYPSYDQEERLLGAAGAAFAVRPVRGRADAVAAAAADADIVFVRESPLPRDALERLTRCRAVIRYGIGVDNIDQQAARERRIYVANVPDYGIDEVSSQAVALALACSRRLLMHDAEVRAGRWSTGVLAPMVRWRGRTLGLVGFGRIARMTHEKLVGFGFGRVLAHDPHVELPPGVLPAGIDEICREADLISLHAPLVADTRHLIDERRIGLMRPTAPADGRRARRLRDRAARPPASSVRPAQRRRHQSHRLVQRGGDARRAAQGRRGGGARVAGPAAAPLAQPLVIRAGHLFPTPLWTV